MVTKQYTLLARLDWFLLIAVTYPVQLIKSYQLVFSDYPLLIFYEFIQGITLFLFTAALAIVIDKLRGIGIKGAKQLSGDMLSKLKSSMDQQNIYLSPIMISRTKVLESDLTMGAHVRGIIQPYVVISGGLLIGLLRGDNKANAIICHELAHISHYDRFLPGLIGLVLFEFFGQITKFYLEISKSEEPIKDIGLLVLYLTIYKFVVFSTTISFVSKYREFYADAKAISICRDSNSYLELLEIASRGKRNSSPSFFHPSLVMRLKEANFGFPILQKALFWRIFWILNFIISWIQWWLSRVLNIGDTETLDYTYCVMIMSAICITLEFFRGTLLSLSDKNVDIAINLTQFIWPGKRVMKYIFLLAGFIMVLLLAPLFGEENHSTAVSIGGALVYATFSSMKKR